MIVKGFFSPSRSEAQLAFIHCLLGALGPLFTLKTSMPAKWIQVFLLVAEKEGLSVTEYAKRGDMAVTTMSRILIDMSERDSRYEDGPGLVEGQDNPMNRREKVYTLTPKGRALLAHITKGVK